MPEIPNSGDVAVISWVVEDARMAEKEEIEGKIEHL